MNAVYTYVENGNVSVPILFGNKPEVEEYVRNLLKNETNVSIDLSPLDKPSNSTHVVVATFNAKATSDLSVDNKTATEEIIAEYYDKGYQRTDALICKLERKGYDVDKSAVTRYIDIQSAKKYEKELNAKSTLTVNELMLKYYNKGYTTINNLFNKLRYLGYDNIEREDVDKFIKESSTEVLYETKNQEQQFNSQQLGVVGEHTIYDRLTKLFPKLIVESTGKNAHVADIHMTDEKYNIKYVFEIKNKTTLTADDLNKFERDLLTMKNDGYRIVGIFISLKCNIPKYGSCNIQRDKCYLSEEFTSDENIKLLIEMYKTILKPLPQQQPVEYIIPENIKQLLYRLKSEYKTLNDQRDMYIQQIQFNNQSNENMHKLLSKLELQKHFINFINQEFIDIEDEETVHETIMDIEEEKLRDYIRATAKSNIRKSDLIEMFPTITKLKTMLLKDIITEYK